MLCTSGRSTGRVGDGGTKVGMRKQERKRRGESMTESELTCPGLAHFLPPPHTHTHRRPGNEVNSTHSGYTTIHHHHYSQIAEIEYCKQSLCSGYVLSVTSDVVEQ